MVVVGIIFLLNDADADGDDGGGARPAPPPAAELAPSPNMLAHIYYIFF